MMYVRVKKIVPSKYITGIPLEKNMRTNKDDMILDIFLSAEHFWPKYSFSKAFWEASDVFG